jgi:redox-sensitive bicupin YhaK (pirin superfamily)
LSTIAPLAQRGAGPTIGRRREVPSIMANQARRIERSVHGTRTSDGAGVKLTRLIGTAGLRRLDPFLLLDEFGSDEPTDYLAGFPDHPHRGFETITYMIAGRFRHKDNHGHEGLLETGGAQWMTAGRGVIHSEMPEQKAGRVAGFQLWVNLPARDKMCAPSYADVQAGDIPRHAFEGGAEARVLAGRVGNAVGPITGRVTEPLYVDLVIAAGAHATIPVPSGLDGFVYPFEGGVSIEATALERGELGVLGAGDAVTVHARGGAARVLVVAGKPLGEPVVQHGPFVMNTAEEIEQAIRDFRAGRF